jgi:sarcosine oxidase delta subunit
MSWEDRKPEGVGDIEHTDDGFTTGVSIPLDEDGYLGRECPACEGPFKIHGDDYEALPEDLVLTCPYCGHEEDHSSFLTSAQVKRIEAAAHGIAEQYVHDVLSDMFGKTFGGPRRRSRRGSFISVETSYKPGRPPPIKALPEIVEEQVRRVVQCSACGNRHAVFSASSFCPICGPRPAAETVLEAITAAREALAMEDRLGEDERETLRAAGVFERFAVDAIESTVSLFEMFAREQFTRRMDDAATHTAGKGNIFQRLDDTTELFSAHTDIDIVELVGDERWERLKRAFARRHVLTHNGGIVDQKFLDRVPDSGLRLGQRLVIRRGDAAQALDDLEAVVRAVGAA